MTTAKKFHCHVKMFDTNVPIDVMVDNATFPVHNISHYEYLSNVYIALVGVFDLNNSKCKLVQVLWVAKNQLLRSSRFPKVQCLDI